MNLNYTSQLTGLWALNWSRGSNGQSEHSNISSKCSLCFDRWPVWFLRNLFFGTRPHFSPIIRVRSVWFEMLGKTLRNFQNSRRNSLEIETEDIYCYHSNRLTFIIGQNGGTRRLIRWVSTFMSLLSSTRRKFALDLRVAPVRITDFQAKKRIPGLPDSC
jgi:hypothetical protein